MKTTMKAVVYDGVLKLDERYPRPGIQKDWALLRVKTAGICRTDLEITKGYMGYKGVLGHEFVGVVEGCERRDLIGRRVVGEINVGCGSCPACLAKNERHCLVRRTLGIHALDGVLAEYCTLPVKNIKVLPDSIADDHAVFVEPLAAAHEILEQVAIPESASCVVLGDGKLGILCAWALSEVVSDITLVGHHRENLALADWNGVRATTELPGPNMADLVVEATGTPDGLMQSINLVRPRGTLILKSTISGQSGLNLSMAVVKELLMVGSRCGPFDRTLKAMSAFQFPLERLIHGRFPFDQAMAAFEAASRKGALKILLDF